MGRKRFFLEVSLTFFSIFEEQSWFFNIIYLVFSYYFELQLAEPNGVHNICLKLRSCEGRNWKMGKMRAKPFASINFSKVKNFVKFLEIIMSKRGTAFYIHFKVSIVLNFDDHFRPRFWLFLQKGNSIFMLPRVIGFAGISPCNFAKKWKWIFAKCFSFKPTSCSTYRMCILHIMSFITAAPAWNCMQCRAIYIFSCLILTDLPMLKAEKISVYSKHEGITSCTPYTHAYAICYICSLNLRERLLVYNKNTPPVIDSAAFFCSYASPTTKYICTVQIQLYSLQCVVVRWEGIRGCHRSVLWNSLGVFVTIKNS